LDSNRPDSSSSSLEQLIRSADGGDAKAREQLFATLYEELRRIAHRELRRRGQSLTLGATTLLHEAYLNISDRDAVAFGDRSRFLAYASKAMRGLVIDYARARQAQKRGGAFEITSLPTELPEHTVDHTELERIGEAVDALAGIDQTLAQVVDLKFFCGYSLVDIAAIRNVSERTVQRDWEKARIILHRLMQVPTTLI
jgi:RNA polymerase sigma factor (TIGR02999 family)